MRYDCKQIYNRQGGISQKLFLKFSLFYMKNKKCIPNLIQADNSGFI